MFARRIHSCRRARDKPFVGLNCAALAASLLESELFGYERGAFTGAVQTKPGLLETAQGGTVLLDEIGEMPIAIQVKLLRVLEERQVLRVGGTKARPIDVRVLSATNRHLEAAIDEGCVPARSLLPAQRHHARDPAAARAAVGDRAARAPVRRSRGAPR